MSDDPDDFDPVVHEYESGHKTRLSTLMLTIGHVAAAGPQGLTARELGVLLWPNDTSGKSRGGAPLSRLHKTGVLRALAETREGHHVYVLPSMVQGRELWAGYRHRGHCETCTCDD